MNNGRGVPQEVRDLVVSTYVPGETSLQDLRRVFGFAPLTIKRILNSAGISHTPVRAKKKVFSLCGMVDSFKFCLLDANSRL